MNDEHDYDSDDADDDSQDDEEPTSWRPGPVNLTILIAGVPVYVMLQFIAVIIAMMGIRTNEATYDHLASLLVIVSIVVGIVFVLNLIAMLALAISSGVQEGRWSRVTLIVLTVILAIAVIGGIYLALMSQMSAFTL